MDKPIGLILAGGRSRRFAGNDKAWLQWQGHSLIQHVINNLRPQVKEIIISANQDLERYSALGYPVIPDKTSGYTGPLMGIYTAMEYLVAQHSTENENLQLVTMPCDMPRLPGNLINQLTDNHPQEKLRVVHDGERLQPLLCVIPLHWKSHLKQYIESGQHRVDKWITSTNPILVDFSAQHDNFQNINDQAQFEALSQLTDHNN